MQKNDTWRWAAGILIFAAFGLMGAIWALSQSSSSAQRVVIEKRLEENSTRDADTERCVRENEQKIAVLENEVGHIRKGVDDIKIEQKAARETQREVIRKIDAIIANEGITPP